MASESKTHPIDVAKIVSDDGLAWVVPVPPEFGFGDSIERPRTSRLCLLEDGRQVGPAHMLHEAIRHQGSGLYSHWENCLYFSTTDGSDPRTNGKEYSVCLHPADSASYPKIVGLETINTCNARCPFCPLFQGDAVIERSIRPASVMDWALFEQCLREIARWQQAPGTIFLNMDGEPLQDPQFERRLRLIAELRLGPLVTLQTNGQFLSEKLSRRIIEANIGSVTVGFDGATQQTYERHRVRCDFHRVLANIGRFARLRDEIGAGTRIAIQYVRTRDNEHEVVDAYKMFGGLLNSKLDIFNDTLSKDWGDARGKADYYFLPKTQKGVQPEGCAIFDDQLIVHCDGTMAACCWDYNLTVSDGGFGNAADAPLLELWRAAKRTELRERLNHGPFDALPDKCQSCPSLSARPIDPTLAKLQGPRVSVQGYGFTYRFAD